MTNRMFWNVGVVTVCAILVASSAAAQEEVPANTKAGIAEVPAKTRIESINELVAAIDAQLAVRTPKGLTRTELIAWTENTKWLQNVRVRYAAHAEELKNRFGSSAGIEAGTSLAEEMAQMNMQFLALQNAVQNESRKFQTLSNASKARHDVALNAIRNLK